MREIEKLIAEISPKPDVPSSVRTLPFRKTETRLPIEAVQENPTPPQMSHAIPASANKRSNPVPLAPRRYKLQETKKKKASFTEKPRPNRRKSETKTRAIPARTRREVFERDEGRCTFVDAEGRTCASTWQVEFHHRIPYARGGTHDPGNIELRCRAHNQYEAELEYGAQFMAQRRRSASPHARGP
jgi:5-methylcytosine-specific restriction endonuclease McrA